jgi:hypothetical protein
MCVVSTHLLPHQMSVLNAFSVVCWMALLFQPQEFPWPQYWYCWWQGVEMNQDGRRGLSLTVFHNSLCLKQEYFLLSEDRRTHRLVVECQRMIAVLQKCNKSCTLIFLPRIWLKLISSDVNELLNKISLFYESWNSKESDWSILYLLWIWCCVVLCIRKKIWEEPAAFVFRVEEDTNVLMMVAAGFFEILSPLYQTPQHPTPFHFFPYLLFGSLSPASHHGGRHLIWYQFVGFVVEKFAVSQVFHWKPGFSHVTVCFSMLHAHIAFIYECCIILEIVNVVKYPSLSLSLSSLFLGCDLHMPISICSLV